MTISQSRRRAATAFQIRNPPGRKRPAWNRLQGSGTGARPRQVQHGRAAARLEKLDHNRMTAARQTDASARKSRLARRFLAHDRQTVDGHRRSRPRRDGERVEIGLADDDIAAPARGEQRRECVDPAARDFAGGDNGIDFRNVRRSRVIAGGEVVGVEPLGDAKRRSCCRERKEDDNRGGREPAGARAERGDSLPIARREHAAHQYRS